jgi:ATP-dependent Clp protease ATP-binding subunit ClpC
MFERYSERARRVLFHTQFAARRLGRVSVESEHLLLALMQDGKGSLSRIFARSNLSLENVRQGIAGSFLIEKGMRLQTVREDIRNLDNDLG